MSSTKQQNLNLSVVMLMTVVSVNKLSSSNGQILQYIYNCDRTHQIDCFPL